MERGPGGEVAQKPLLSAAVLGLVFEKINGYRDGSFYTPGFVTMYMARHSLRRAVVRCFTQGAGAARFPELRGCDTWEELRDSFDKKRRREYAAHFNTLTVLDPAVGSGHFLVSALNELLACKADLRLLLDADGQLLDYALTVEHDELRIVDNATDLPARYLRTHGYDPAPSEQKVRLVNQVLAQLEKPAHYYLIQLEGRTRLSLLPLGDVLETFPGTDPIAALRRFVPMALGRRALETELRQVRQTLERRAEEADTAAAHARQRLHALAHEAGYRNLADLIMAHLHEIPAGATQHEVLDFYTGEPRTLKLKASEKPQKTAENLYRKAKNQQIEERQLGERIARRDAEALFALERLEELDTQPALAELRGLRAWRRLHGLDPAQAAAQAARELPFKVFEDRGFTILVGRNSANNDLLTQKYAHKDDLWLHAKDVSGSHVVIRHKAGQPTPEPVIEHAAQLAAWYSRRQHDSLCPVTVTPKKFVRKPKGALPGQVIVERERVVLVQPGNPFEKE